jgi:hypothetical protein
MIAERIRISVYIVRRRRIPVGIKRGAECAPISHPEQIETGSYAWANTTRWRDKSNVPEIRCGCLQSPGEAREEPPYRPGTHHRAGGPGHGERRRRRIGTHGNLGSNHPEQRSRASCAGFRKAPERLHRLIFCGQRPLWR